MYLNIYMGQPICIIKKLTISNSKFNTYWCYVLLQFFLIEIIQFIYVIINLNKNKIYY